MAGGCCMIGLSQVTNLGRKWEKYMQICLKFLTAYRSWPEVAHMQQMLLRNLIVGFKVGQLFTKGLIKVELYSFLSDLDEFIAVIPW